MNFLMVIMPSGIDRGHVRTMTMTTATATELRIMAAILQILHVVDRDMQPWFTVYFFDIAHPFYNQLKAVKSRYLLTSIT